MVKIEIEGKTDPVELDMSDEEAQEQWDMEVMDDSQQWDQEEPYQSEEASINEVEVAIARLEKELENLKNLKPDEDEERQQTAIYQLNIALESIPDEEPFCPTSNLFLKGDEADLEPEMTSKATIANVKDTTKYPSGYAQMGDTGFGGASIVGTDTLDEAKQDYEAVGISVPEVSGFRLRFSTYNDKSKKTTSEKNYLVPGLCGSQKVIVPTSGNPAQTSADWLLGVSLTDQIGLERRQDPKSGTSYMQSINDPMRKRFWRNKDNQYRYNFCTAFLNNDHEVKSLQRYQDEYGAVAGLFAWSKIKQIPEKLVMMFQLVGTMDEESGQTDRYGTEMWEESDHGELSQKYAFKTEATKQIYQESHESQRQVMPLERGLEPTMSDSEEEEQVPLQGNPQPTLPQPAAPKQAPTLPRPKQLLQPTGAPVPGSSSMALTPTLLPPARNSRSGKHLPQQNPQQPALEEQETNLMKELQAELDQTQTSAEEKVKIGKEAILDEIQNAIKDIDLPKADLVDKSTGATRKVILTRAQMLELLDSIMQMEH